MKNPSKVIKNYTYVRRSDLEKILHEEAASLNIPIHYGRHIKTIKNTTDQPTATLSDGSNFSADIIIGADGLNSQVRNLIFGEPKQFHRYLGLYVAGFEVKNKNYIPKNTFAIVEAKRYQMACYPSVDNKLNVLYVLRSTELPRLSPQGIVSFVQENTEDDIPKGKAILNDSTLSRPVYFSPVTQIIMPKWHKKRVALVGDASGCLTFLSGQGSHMALAGAYVLANELTKSPDSIEQALTQYQNFMQPHVQKKQREARRLVNILVPHAKSKPRLRRFIVKMFVFLASRKVFVKLGGAKSILTKY